MATAILKLNRGTIVQDLHESEPFFESDVDVLHIGTDDIGGYITLVKLNGTNVGSLALTGTVTAVHGDFSGNLDVDGDLFVGGDITLGSGGDDVIFVGAPLSGSLIPQFDSSYDLGSVNKKWNTIYVDNLEASSITGSISIDFVDISNKPALVSGSSQVDHNATTNYVNSQHTDHSTLNIIAGNGLSGGGLLTASRTLTLDTDSIHFTDGVKNKLNIEGVISGSIQVDLSQTTNYEIGITNVLDTNNVFSSSAQVNADTITNFDINVADYIVSQNVHSGSYLGIATTTNLPEGTNLYYTDSRVKDKLNVENVISGSEQVDFGLILNKPTLVSGSSQIDSATTTNKGIIEIATLTEVNVGIDTERAVVPSTLTSWSGSTSIDTVGTITVGDVSTILPIGTISGSSQVNADNITNFDTNVKDKLNVEGVISGSSQVTITESQISDLDHYTDTDTLTYINSIGVISGSSQVNADTITNFDTNVKDKLNVDNVHSGSYLGTATTDNLPEASNLYYTDVRVKTKLDTEGVISGSSQVNADTITNFDTNVKDKLNVEGVISGSSQLDGTTIDNLTLTNTTATGIFSGSFENAAYVNVDNNFHVTQSFNGDIVLNDSNITGVKSLFFSGSAPDEKITWNSLDHTLNVHTGVGDTVVQVGQELVQCALNNTAAPIPNGSVVYRTGTTTINDGVEVPNVELAYADTHETLITNVGVATNTLSASGGRGFVAMEGKVRGIDLSGLSKGPVYLSSTVPGGLTNTRPVFPNYTVFIGFVLENTVDGVLLLDIRNGVDDTYHNFFNGTFRESFDFRTTCDGVNITGSLTPSNGHDDMTMIFSDGLTMLDTSPSASIQLTAGTDANPQTNYVYIPNSTKVLTVSTSDWPTTLEHIKIAQVVLRSAATTQTDGALRNQNINDHLQSTHTNQGHLTHIGERIRLEASKYYSGIDFTCTINAASTPDDVWISTTAGTCYQMHRQTFPAFNTQTGDDIHIVNHPTTPYLTVSNLNTTLTTSAGVSLNNTSFSFVVWGVVNKTDEKSHLMLNLPTDTYAFVDSAAAISDANNYSVYNIPKIFNGVGFLIARFTFTYKNDVWTLEDSEDLRGKIPNAVAGGGGAGGGGITTFLGLTDTPNSYAGLSGSILQINDAETGIDVVDITASTIVDFDSAVKTKMDLDNVLSGSITEADISDLTHYTDSDVKTKLDTEGVISGSSQVDYTELQNIPSGIISGSSQVNADTIVNFDTNVKDKLDLENVISGSVQVNADDVTNFDTNVKTKLDTDNVHSGSYLGTATTDNLTEGDNLYYTDVRVKDKLNVENVISGSSQLTGSYDSRYVNVTGDENISGNKTFTDNVIITGDLTINGTATSINSTVVQIDDNFIEVNVNPATSNGGLYVRDLVGTVSTGSIMYDVTNNIWKAGVKDSEIEIVTISGTQTLTNKTINGSQLVDASVTEAKFSFTDITTANATTASHGLLPKLGGGTTNFLRSDGTWSAPAYTTDTDTTYSISSVTTTGGAFLRLTAGGDGSGTDDVKLANGSGITAAFTDVNTITITNTDLGSAQNIFKNFTVTDTNSGYTWAAAGIVAADSNSDTITLVSGGGIDLDVDTTLDAILVQHSDTSTQTSINNSGRTYIQDIELDTYGHITTINSATETSPAGSGSVNYVSKWTGANTLGDSSIYDDGTNVGIGTTASAYKLTVSGSTKFGDTLNDVHFITGSISISGSISADFIPISGSHLTNKDYVDSRTTIATTTQAIAGVSDTVLMSPLKTNEVLELSYVPYINAVDDLYMPDNSITTSELFISSSVISYNENNDVDSAASEVVALVPTGSYDGSFFDYVVKSGTNLRAGTVMAVHDGTSVSYTDNSTTDLGSTSGVELSVDINSGNMRLIATVTTDNWLVKTMVRSI